MSTSVLGLLQRHLQFGQFAQQLIDVWQKLMQRRIEQTNGYRQAGHLAKDADEVAALQRQQFLQRFLASADAVRKNHLAHCGQSLIAKEHVLSATQADAFGAKRRAQSLRRSGVSAFARTRKSAKLVGPLH